MSLNDNRAGACIHRRFERQAAHAPHASALQGPEGSATYAELNARANRLARHLCRQGVRPGALVALCLERGAALVTSMLAVLKTGAAYVPVDPAYPAARIAFMLADADPALTLATRASAAVLPASARPLLLDEAPWQAEDDIDLPRDVDAGSLAYVMYTSGSSGRPKGVLVEHRQLACHVDAFTALVGLTARDRVLQFAAPAFDVLAEEVWPTLLAGATLVLRDPGPADALAAFTRQVETRRITVLNLPASFWHPWCDHVLSSGARLAALRQLVVGSEVVQPGRVRAWQAHFGYRIAIANAYGPTETTITATAQQLPPLPAHAARVPIGQPLAGTSVAVLDAQGLPVAAGEPGELYIGGARLARGYLNRPDHTEECFVTVGGQRMYRTGDLVARLPDGALDFLGRIDGQLKVHGHRVEPGDVEACLVRHPRVGAAVVIADDGGLVAYVTPADAQPVPAPAELHALARAALPPYMVPAAYVRLDALPLTANGKLDRRALPAPCPAAYPAQDYDAPQGDAERELAALWCALLKLPRVGRHDDFFALGADVPAALGLVARLRDRGMAIDVTGLCRRPTLATLAALAAAPPHGAAVAYVDADGDTPTSAFGLHARAHGTPATARRHVDPALALRLRAQARRLVVMLAGVVHVAWALVLARGAGTDDVTFGTVLPGMPTCAGSGATGPAAALPLRLTLGGLDAAHAVRNAHAALATLLDRPTAAAACGPFHALLEYRHGTAAAPPPSAPDCPLVLTVDDVDGALRLTVRGDAAIGPARIGDFLDCALYKLADALEHAATGPVTALDVMPAPERARLLGFAEARALPDQGCLHGLVEAAAARAPEAVALVSGAERLTYEALNERANRLAHHLQALGVGPDQPVVLYLPAGTALAVAALAVLKAGGACAAVDRQASAERLAFVLADTGARVLLTESGVAVPDGSAAVLRLDEAGPWRAMPRANPASATTPAHLAWIVHGRSGAGVPLAHRNVTRLFPATFAHIDCGADDAWAVCASPASDLFVWELWGALVTGARAVLVPPAASRSAPRLLRLLERERVTVLNQRAGQFAQLARADKRHPAELALRHVIFRGDAPPADMLAAWLARRSVPPRMHALHGSAEVGIHATWRALDPAGADGGPDGGTVGRPLADIALYVLDARGLPAPIGVAGEVHVGGPGLAAAYLNRPDLTARRFVVHPLAPGERLFRTGVRACWRVDGTLDAAAAGTAVIQAPTAPAEILASSPAPALPPPMRLQSAPRACHGGVARQAPARARHVLGAGGELALLPTSPVPPPPALRKSPLRARRRALGH
ncbi:amino acid adenylation domain-containing protein [Pseudoduganella flava]|uniref:Amino acid adenylation domain-containing protein n=1 Tax=Pseudoduganella flava TaxID=871742 RepID=A0A562PKP6_9BURK|nr:amino acid adenylation domain-containing protein [Pseudoduganella flava]QGZ42437.1 amino acid adenylation domain-containing protein [Pseudoduganella flava]TWI45004.1 amino acid adenylation domain-containing protein [Pseudoduganella flava]